MRERRRTRFDPNRRVPWLCALAVTSLLSGIALWAQSSPGKDSDSSPVIHVTSKLVLLDAIVENKKTGELIGTLGQDDFRIYEDGVQQKVSYFSHNQLPLSVVFLFDLTDTVQPILKPLAEGALEPFAYTWAPLYTELYVSMKS